MSNNKITVATEPDVIAIAQEENKLRAVCLRRQPGNVEVLWTKSCDINKMSWRLFAAECGIGSERAGKTKTGAEKILVAGFNYIIYRIIIN